MSRGSDYGKERGRYRGASRSPPFGVQVIVILGGFFTVLAMIGALGLLAVGGLFALVGLLVLVLGAGQLAAYYGLYLMEPWGWTWTLILHGLGVILSLVSIQGGVDVVGILVSLIVIGYVYSLRDLYRSGGSTRG